MAHILATDKLNNVELDIGSGILLGQLDESWGDILDADEGCDFAVMMCVRTV